MLSAPITVRPTVRNFARGAGTGWVPAYQEYEFRERHSENLVLSNRLSGKHLFSDRLEFDWAGSYSILQQ